MHAGFASPSSSAPESASSNPLSYSLRPPSPPSHSPSPSPQVRAPLEPRSISQVSMISECSRIQEIGWNVLKQIEWIFFDIMFRQLNRESQEEFENHNWGDEKSNRVIEVVTRHIEIFSEIAKTVNPHLVEVCTNAKHLLIQLKYNISYAKKNYSQQPQSPTPAQPPVKQTTETIVNELDKMRRLSVNRFLSEFNEKQTKKQSMMIPGSLNYHLKFQSKEIQTNLLECEVETMVKRIQNYEVELKGITEINESLIQQNEEKKLELLSVNKSLMNILMEKAIIEAQFSKVRELKPSIIEKIVIDYSEIEKRVNEGYDNIIEKVIKYSAQNIFKENEYTATVPSGKRRLKCGTTLNLMILPKSRENLEILHQYYSNFQKPALNLNETENLIKSVEVKEQKIYELERKIAQMENSQRDKSLRILKEKVTRKGVSMPRFEEKETQTGWKLGVKVMSKQELRKMIWASNSEGEEHGDEHGEMNLMEGDGSEVQTDQNDEGKGMGESSIQSQEDRTGMSIKQEDSGIQESIFQKQVEKGSHNLNIVILTKGAGKQMGEAENEHNDSKGGMVKKDRKQKKQGSARKKSLVKGSQGVATSPPKQPIRNKRNSRRDEEPLIAQISSNQNESLGLVNQKQKKTLNVSNSHLSLEERNRMQQQQCKEQKLKYKYASLKQDIHDLEFRTKNLRNQRNEIDSIRDSISNVKNIKKTAKLEFISEGENLDPSKMQEYSQVESNAVRNKQEEGNNSIYHYQISGDQQSKNRMGVYGQGSKGKEGVNERHHQEHNKESETGNKENRGLVGISKASKQSIYNQRPKPTINNRTLRRKNSSQYQKVEGVSGPINPYPDIRKRIESLPILQQSKQLEKSNSKPPALPKLSKCHHQHQTPIQHDKLTHIQSKKIQEKIQKLQEQIQKSGKGRANNSRVQLHKYMKLLETIHKTCGSDCKYLQRAWQTTYNVPHNKKQFRIPKYDLVYDEEEDREKD